MGRKPFNFSSNTIRFENDFDHNSQHAKMDLNKFLPVLSKYRTYMETQHVEVEMNKTESIRAMTTTAWKAIPQRSIITLVWNPTTSGP